MEFNFMNYGLNIYVCDLMYGDICKCWYDVLYEFFCIVV